MKRMRSLSRTAWLAAILAFAIANGAVLAHPLFPTEAPLAERQEQVQAQRPRRGTGRRGENLLEPLNLTESQRQQIASIREQYRGKANPLRDKMRAAQAEMRSLMAGSESETVIRAKHQEIVNLRQQLDQLRFEGMLETRAVLTPEQRSQFNQQLEQRQRRFRDRDDWMP